MMRRILIAGSNQERIGDALAWAADTWGVSAVIYEAESSVAEVVAAWCGWRGISVIIYPVGLDSRDVIDQYKPNMVLTLPADPTPGIALVAHKLGIEAYTLTGDAQ